MREPVEIDRQEAFTKTMDDVIAFCARFSSLRLRSYQAEVARALVDSVMGGRGLSFVVVFPRQSGKNELQAQVETFLLLALSGTEAEIIKVSPTWKPQSLNAMRRLERVLGRNLITRTLWEKERGYIYKIGSARIFFLSGSPEANIVGATASTLLEVDEAQDVGVEKFDKDIGPMAASTNATRVFWGTAWTSRTLLGRELRAAQAAQQADGRQRVFVIDAGVVAAEVPAYGDFVAEQVAKLGRNHPLVKTQYFSEEIDAEGGMFPAGRIALMQGKHARLQGPRPGCIYALLLDVAGEDEASAEPGENSLKNPGRDATALTVVEVDLATLGDELIKAPTYKVVSRCQWVGTKHTALYGQLRALAEHWRARYMVVDATGVGAGLASFLDKALPGKVLPFVFNGSTKSKLGWEFLGAVETGRFKDYAELDAERATFLQQLEACQMEVVSGPDRKMKWGVPDGTRDTSGQLIHDDLVLSAALLGVLDGQEWSVSGPALVAGGADPLVEMDRGF